jgi:hypothetical protein
MTYPLVIYNTEFPDNLEKFYEYIANDRVFNKRIRERELLVYGGSAQGTIIPSIWNVHEPIGFVTSIVVHDKPHVNFKPFENFPFEEISKLEECPGLTPDFSYRADPYKTKKIQNILEITRFGITTIKEERDESDSI